MEAYKTIEAVDCFSGAATEFGKLKGLLTSDQALGMELVRSGMTMSAVARLVNNGVLEGLNSLVQAIKRAARGFRNPNYLVSMIYLRLGDLDLRLPTCLPA